MSHLTRIRTTLREPALLAAALRATGHPHVEVHDRPQRLTSRWGWSADAEVIVRQAANPGIGHDFGFARDTDGVFTLVIDDMQRRQHNPDWLSRLSREYGHAAALHFAETNGYDVVTNELEHDGTRRLTLRRTT